MVDGGDVDDTAAGAFVRLSEQLVQAMARFGPPWVRFLRSATEDDSVSSAGARLLSALSKHPRPPIMRDLVNEMGTTARAVTGLVDTLEREGLVRRARHPTDRRATLLTLTEEGERRAQRAWHDQVARVSTLFTVLSPQEQADMIRILDKLTDGLAARGQRVAPRAGRVG
jgi:DNA-binding MarR family transcriptional regulator